MYLEESGLLPELQQQGFDVVAFACTTCNGMSGALDPEIQKEVIERDLYPTAVLSGNRNFDGRIHPYAKQAFLASPPLVVALHCRYHSFRYREGCAGPRSGRQPDYAQDIWPSDEEIDAIVKSAVKPEQFRKTYIPCSRRRRWRTCREPAVRLASAVYLHSSPALLGRHHGRSPCAERHASAGSTAG